MVNAGALPHSISGYDVVALVTCGKVKLANLRARPQVSLTFRSRWEWATVEGRAELIGPDDRRPGIDADGLRLLLRQVFKSFHRKWL